MTDSLATRLPDDLPDTAPVTPPAAPPLWLLALITFSGTLAMHIFVPVLPLAGRTLQAEPAEMQLTISFYILGLAIGQLFYGPVSDRYGRRPILLVGLAVYFAASLVALFAPDVHVLIGARLVQALGGCAGLVIGRAIVRDVSGSEAATRRLAIMNLMVVLGPSFAPIVGSMLGAVAGWRSIFVFLCLLGLANSLLTWKILPETVRRSSDQTAATVVKNYLGLLRTPAFLGYSIGGSCGTTSFYAFIAAAPFIFVNQLHRPDHEIGIYLAIVALGYWTGSLAASRLAGRIRVSTLLRGANILSTMAALVLLVISLTGHMNVVTVVVTMFAYTLGAGTISPAAMAQSLSVNPKVAGSASGLYGFFQMAIGAAATALAGFSDNHAFAAATVVLGACIITQIAFMIANRSARLTG